MQEQILKELMKKPCPFCGSNKLYEGKQAYYANINRGFHGRALKHIFCAKCGSIIHSYVENPEKLLSKLEREDLER
ncbi:MAG: Lar family restriction alleviation protein [Tissierellia bacterium]|nr:Lar family restriction alleviation protein [Tissierellia bacterium]